MIVLAFWWFLQRDIYEVSNLIQMKMTGLHTAVTCCFIVILESNITPRFFTCAEDMTVVAPILYMTVEFDIFAVVDGIQRE